jgi:hypothetical protein
VNKSSAVNFIIRIVLVAVLVQRAIKYIALRLFGFTNKQSSKNVLAVLPRLLTGGGANTSGFCFGRLVKTSVLS